MSKESRKRKREPEAPKRGEKEPLWPIFELCVMYLDYDPSWAERHILARTWMIHMGWQSDPWQETNDQAGALEIMKTVHRMHAIPVFLFQKFDAHLIGPGVISHLLGAHDETSLFTYDVCVSPTHRDQLVLLLRAFFDECNDWTEQQKGEEFTCAPTISKSR